MRGCLYFGFWVGILQWTSYSWPICFPVIFPSVGGRVMGEGQGSWAELHLLVPGTPHSIPVGGNCQTREFDQKFKSVSTSNHFYFLKPTYRGVLFKIFFWNKL